MSSILVEVEGLKKYFSLGRRFFSEKVLVRAVDGIDFSVKKGETFSLVGESGCGKTTTARLILRLIEPTAGTVRFQGADIFEQGKSDVMKLRREMQIIFQDPLASLNPRKTVRQILSKPYLIHNLMSKKEAENQIKELLELVSLVPVDSYLHRYPHALSGGEKQRVGIARAIAVRPKFIVADEPVSSLDVSVQAKLLNLLKDLKRKLDLTCLFITHDLAVVRSISDEVAVMYLGKIVELAEVNELYSNALHPYTRAILSATPIPDPRKARTRKKQVVGGEPPSPINPPTGCRFHTRCSHAEFKCAEREPEMIEVSKGHVVACHLIN